MLMSSIFEVSLSRFTAFESFISYALPRKHLIFILEGSWQVINPPLPTSTQPSEAPASRWRRAAGDRDGATSSPPRPQPQSHPCRILETGTNTLLLGSHRRRDPGVKGND